MKNPNKKYEILILCNVFLYMLFRLLFFQKHNNTAIPWSIYDRMQLGFCSFSWWLVPLWSNNWCLWVCSRMILLYLLSIHSDKLSDNILLFISFQILQLSFHIFRGLLVNDEFQLLKQDKEIVSTSNFLYIVFRPDEFVHHDGFRIYYRYDVLC